MILPDINILVYAHRAESPFHEKASLQIANLVESLVPFALCGFVCTGFLRLVTHHRLFVDPTPVDQALEFLDNLVSQDHCRMVEPGDRHWQIFSKLVRETPATGNLVSDAHLAAITIEHGCELLTNDADFFKFPALKIQRL